jgi:tryptophan synthase alpha chain
VTGGLPGVDAALLRDLAQAGADAIEVGLPFSDPIMDGGVIQEASRLALEGGVRTSDVLALVEEASVDVPVAVMTYYNPVLRHGVEAFLAEAAGCGVAGVIVPDLPVDEADELVRACHNVGIAPVLLAAPGTAPDRLREIAAASAGFVYCVATYGVTGARDELGATAQDLVASLRRSTDLPLLVGVGIGSPAQAREASVFADGVIVGSALMARLVAGDRKGMLALARSFREAIPGGGVAVPSVELEG